MRILSVDDKPENRYLMEALLKGNGFEVQSAGNGAEALELLARERFDCILSDILMPVMDGFELCRRVKADPRFREIPFIVFTATYTGPQDEAFALRIGAARFLQKPCEPDILVAAIREVLASARSAELAPSSIDAEEEEVLKLYNQRLVRKLEQKMLELEREIDARNRAEDILRRSESDYRRLFHSIRDALLVLDIHQRITNCNRAFVDLFGYPLEEMLGQHPSFLFEDQARYDRLGTELRSLSDDSTRIYQIRFRKKEGVVFPGEANVFRLYDDKGQMTGYIGLVRDVTQGVEAETQRQQLAAQLLQAQKMESIGRLAGGVAHDFNNMLSVILGYAQMALNKTGPGQPVHEYLLQIADAAQRSAEMTRKLLGFARKQAIVPREIDLNQAVTGMLKMLRRLIGEKISLVWQPQEGIWPILIDPTQVDQILANLCVNARDAMDQGGTITISTGMVSLTESLPLSHGRLPAGEYVVLRVSDEGCGIEPSIREQIFEPFFTTKEEGKGTGLGLSTVYGIIQQNNGFIDVHSNPRRGTAISIYLPRHHPAPRESVGVETAVPRGRGETILVVEDEEGLLRSTSALLTSLGYTVLSASRPTEAIRLARAVPGGVHLLLTDMVMPELSGNELAQLLRTFFPGMHCLFMSGYSDALAAEEQENVQDQRLGKPFSLEELASAVNAALHRRP
jgi:PAS domain S-box-containing protein